MIMLNQWPYLWEDYIKYCCLNIKPYQILDITLWCLLIVLPPKDMASETACYLLQCLRHLQHRSWAIMKPSSHTPAISTPDECYLESSRYVQIVELCPFDRLYLWYFAIRSAVWSDFSNEVVPESGWYNTFLVCFTFTSISEMWKGGSVLEAWLL